VSAIWNELSHGKTYALLRLPFSEVLELLMRICPIIKISLIVFAAITAIFDRSYQEVAIEIGWEAVIAGLLFFPAIVLIG